MKKNNKKTTIFVTSLIVIACLTIGYALLSTTLDINGTGILSGNTWDIHWANVQVNSESTQSNTQEAIISSSTQVVFNINLNEPGDFYEFTVDAVNEGTIDGMIDVISTNVYQSNGTTPATLPSAITYSITYDDDTPLEQYQLLSADSYETYKIRVEYKRDIENSELITTNQTYVMKVSVTYKQADENAIDLMAGIIPNYNESGGCATITNDSSGGGGNATMSGLTLMMKNASQGEDDPSWFTNSADNQSQFGVYTRKGTSNDKYPIYYYRGKFGNVNNNLKFNGYCWKIIRTTATGGVRIIYNGPIKNGSCEIQLGSLETNITTQVFNTFYQEEKYIKYQFDDNGNKTDSKIKKTLENWYNTNMSNVDDKVERSVYCNDTSKMSNAEKSALNLDTSLTYYCPYKRVQNSTPTTLCSKKSDAYRVKVGFLTVDEEALVGRSLNNGIQDYLFNSNYYWTGSPNSFDGSYAKEFYVNYSFHLNYSAQTNTVFGIRPVITLKSNTSYTGTGTTTNPFVVS